MSSRRSTNAHAPAERPDRPPYPGEVVAELARRSLRRYIRAAWPVVEPGNEYVPGWHIDAIADHLEAVSRGQIRRLVINIPPRHAKSLICAVFWPTWAWLRKPSSRWLTASYAGDLAVRDAVKSRRVIESSWYRGVAGDGWRLAGDQNVKSRYENTATGHRVAVGVGGSATGEGGDVVLVDDPHSALQAQSDAERENALVWWDQTMHTRLNDPKTGALVIIMQRLHERDLTGHVLTQGGYEHLCIRTEFEVEDAKRKTSIGWTDPRTTEGELMWPVRFGEAENAGTKRALGSYGYSGQHGQRPAPAGGSVFQRVWFKFWRKPPDTGTVVWSWDFSFKDHNDSSYVVGQRWLFSGADMYLTRQIRKHIAFPESLKAVKDNAEKGAIILIEDKANGPAVISSIRREVPGIIAVEPDGSKEARAQAVSPFVEAGNVWLPHPDQHQWVGSVDGGQHDDPESFLGEVCKFPKARHDDQVDGMTQALARVYLKTQTVVVKIDPSAGYRGNQWEKA